jgi:hypothetical protein
MKNYLIGTLAVIIVFLVSVIYKQQKTIIFTHFPIQEEMETQSDQPPLYLFLFFSKKNCASCLEIVKVLNELSSPLYVLGIVPDDELEDEQALRRITGATFPLSSFNKYGKYIPWYTPTLICVSPSGKIVFVLPEIAVPSRDIENVLTSVYGRLYDSLEKEKKE